MVMDRAPTPYDGPTQGYPPTLRWLDKSNDNSEWFLLNYNSAGGVVTANWVLLNYGSSSLNQLNGNTGFATPTAGEINVVGDSSGIQFAGSGSTLTASLANIPNSSLQNSSITLVAGPGISISTSPVSLGGSTTISASAVSFAWSVIITSAQSLSVNAGYFANYASGPVSFTLPATCNVGDTIKISGMTTGNGWVINQNTSQYIVVGALTSTTSTGSVASTINTDSIELVCCVANTCFNVTSYVGNLLVT